MSASSTTDDSNEKYHLYPCIDKFILDAIPWLLGQESEIRPVSYFVLQSLKSNGILDFRELPGVIATRGPAILSAANRLRDQGNTPRQVVLRAMLAAGIPSDPARRDLIEGIATHVDAIVADFDNWFLSWDNLAADPNAWQFGEIDRFLLIADKGGFGALSSQEWGMEWWVIILIDGNGGGLFDPADTMKFNFSTRWQRVLGLKENTLDMSVMLDEVLVDYLLSTCFPMLPAARVVLKPDRSSREEWKRTGADATETYRHVVGQLYTFFETLDPNVTWDGGAQRPYQNETLGGVKGVFTMLGPHVMDMINDLTEKMDPITWPDERLIAWMQSINATRDLYLAMHECKNGEVTLPKTIPRDFIPWITRFLHSNAKDEYIELLINAKPMAQETCAYLLTRTFSNEGYPEMWHVASRLKRFLGTHDTNEELVYWRFWLAWSIEWRTRLGFDITFQDWNPWYDEVHVDPRLPAFGLTVNQENQQSP